MSKNIKHITPVLSTSDIERDIKWYKEKIGFNFQSGQDGYAVLQRDNQWIHLQWHHNTKEDPIYSSVVKLFVDNIKPIFEEMIERGTITKDKLHLNTPWNTNEFGFYDLNKNAIFFVADVE